ncbi:MAG: hypothetical protein ABJA78_00760 [Ferruginibacter sp.]
MKILKVSLILFLIMLVTDVVLTNSLTPRLFIWYDFLKGYKLADLYEFDFLSSHDFKGTPMIDKSGIREINGSQYVCVVKSTNTYDALFYHQVNLVKLELRGIQTGTNIFTTVGIQPAIFVEITRGLSSGQAVVMRREKNTDFDCGKP